jgi:hypothetical protein
MITHIVLHRMGNVGCGPTANFPRWAAEWIFRTAGGATPGRGGRRKRRRAASEWREINAWSHYDALELLRRSSMRRNVRREVPLKEPGYRERRRVAKLRRRRARSAQRPERQRLAEATRQALWRGFRQESEWVKNRMARTT